MGKLSKGQMQAAANGIATLMSLAQHSLSPTQTDMATRSAGNLLWLMGIERYEAHGRTFFAIAPEGDTIDIEPTKLLEAGRA